MDPNDRTGDEDDLELEEEPGGTPAPGDVDSEQDPDQDPASQLRSALEENARLKAAHNESLREKGNYEELRRRYRSVVGRLRSQSEQGSDISDAERNLIEAGISAMKTSDDPRDQAVLSLMRQLNNELLTTRRHLADVAERAEVRVPSRHKKALAELMETGEYNSRKAALRVLMLREKLAAARNGGDRQEEVATEPKGEERQRRPVERRQPAGRTPVSTYVRPVTIREAMASGKIKASQYRTTMEKGGPEAEKLLALERAFKLEVISGA
jgi:hypothetical protein